jgi:ABC-type phosphate/phosphonate transport system substrate-binding protein
MNVLQALVAPLAREGRFFSSVQVSGAHERSLAMVTEGSADIAAIDCITYALLQRHRPAALAGTRVIHETAALTAPPYVTGTDTDPELLPVLRTAIDEAIAALDPGDRKALGLKGVEAAELADFQAIEELRQRAQNAGYSELAAHHS